MCHSYGTHNSYTNTMLESGCFSLKSYGTDNVTLTPPLSLTESPPRALFPLPWLARCALVFEAVWPGDLV